MYRYCLYLEFVSMIVRDLRNALVAAPPDARLTLKLSDGSTVEIESVKHHCQLVEIIVREDDAE